MTQLRGSASKGREDTHGSDLAIFTEEVAKGVLCYSFWKVRNEEIRRLTIYFQYLNATAFQNANLWIAPVITSSLALVRWTNVVSFTHKRVS